MDQIEDPDEAEAWAAMRAAFADVDAEAGASREQHTVSPSKPAVAEPQGKTAQRAGVVAGAPAKAVAKAKPPPLPRQPAAVSEDDWLQSEVDRLVGEVQRTAQAPLPGKMLKVFWGLPLEEQQDVLLGALGSQGGDVDAEPAKRAERLWRLVGDEVQARLRLPGQKAAPPGRPAGAPPGRPKAPSAAAGRGRSRSRSPSL